MHKAIREKINQKLKGFEYRQQARDRERSVHRRKRRAAAMMRQQGTLNGARLYLRLKDVQFQEWRDSLTGNIIVTVPGQISLTYGPDGRFIGSRGVTA